MSSPAPLPPAGPAARRGPSRLKLFFWLVIVPLALVAGYFWVVLKWSYSSGERAGWVQQFSKRGWLCKTWEGEMAMVTMPGSSPEKFYFTVWDDAVAEHINRVMGKRVTLHYDQKVGLPTTCFGETRYVVSAVKAVEEIPLAPGIVVPVPGQEATKSPPASATPASPAPATPSNTAPPPTLPEPVAPAPQAPVTPATEAAQPASSESPSAPVTPPASSAVPPPPPAK